MTPLISKYRAAMHPMHGWRVELTCSGCGFHGQPRYEGHMQIADMNSGDRPTIYAKLACPKCGRRLTEEAGGKLAELFKDVSVPERNMTYLRDFIAGLFIVPLAFACLLFVGVYRGWWGYSAFVILALSAVFIQPLIMIRDYRIAKLRARCDCGKPDYLFMGLLGRTSCFRCSACGRMVILRD